MKQVYLDWAATSPPYPAAIKKMHETSLELYGNPSSLHEEGKKAREALENYRERCAALLGCEPKQITFTSGASEANTLVLTSLLQRKRDRHLCISSIEHASVEYQARVLESLRIPVDRVPLSIGKASNEAEVALSSEQLASSINRHTAMVSIMTVNNETGAIMPVPMVRRVIDEAAEHHGKPIHFHSDISQAAGKIPVDLDKLGLNSATLSAHKFSGPRGAGILYSRVPLDTIVGGGGQENSMRPGTENLAAVAGMTVALETAVEKMEHNRQQACEHSEILIDGIRDIGGDIIPADYKTAPFENIYRNEEISFSPFILTAAFPPIPGELLTRVLDREGFSVSTGSACSSRGKRDLRVLTAFGVSAEKAASAIRISIGHSTGKQDIHRFLDVLKEQVANLKAVSS
ncbi:MAG: cysteine desulfurase [Spirochaetales bacterium]|nr:cysteine desulfurase [Spirochaetales bacterium]MCF7937174.1 cysteine desulfurase [Spirochaetales bacterium]